MQYLTESSKNKFNDYKFQKYINIELTPNLISLFDKMFIAANKDIKLISHFCDTKIIKNVFIDFDENINEISNSIFQKSVLNIPNTSCFKLTINSSIITLIFLFETYDYSYVSAIIHAINTFCHTFNYDYNNLTIYVCLDDNERNLVEPYYNNNIYDRQKKLSQAFNVSGVTQRGKKTIILTKKQEIIKLLYHEMVHYIGLDHELLSIDIKFNWNTVRQKMNLSEVYAEFMAVVLNSIFQSIHIYCSNTINNNRYDIFKNILCLETTYSLWLTARIMKFFGYNFEKVDDFFNGIGKIKYDCPILIWEYIILRSQLLLNIGHIDVNDWKINTNNINDTVQLILIDDNFIHLVKSFIKNIKDSDKNISYNLIDIDWNII
ncbi:hypothetical protein QLL95_gp1167 [Cotonvirus japonicus]|uniref:Uncharacterized protein n=1 Tax=Cotonvirus japonicus TaxID=2811091 RepID=A0ABM7NS75_9VIRU|nr:hypothetical protein QLL95_gp1167 [Cotonvirus japonicus]BCS82956.1 hypothetical protein [Cotonvirus japonicus]